MMVFVVHHPKTGFKMMGFVSSTYDVWGLGFQLESVGYPNAQNAGVFHESSLDITKKRSIIIMSG